MKEACNLDLQSIKTPIDSVKLEQLLTEVDYDVKKRQYLINGFKHGFSLEYQGGLNGCKRLAPNLKLRVGNKLELWNKVMNEVELGRYAGPFEQPPYDCFVQSSIGLVPKDKGTKTRLIFHMSYPRNGESVNSGIPYEKCTVKYPDFNEAVNLCLQEGVGCSIGKSDMSSTFRHVRMIKDQWWLLVMKAAHPVIGKIWYFVDKCLPFGSSISCAIFQAISDAIAWLVQFRTKKPNVNYLDDYLFAAALKAMCDSQIQVFLDICKDIRFPVALEKTFWGESLMIFLGLLLDTYRQVICIPMDKLIKANNWVEFFLSKTNKKPTLKEFQKLTGILNFLCKCIVPGRAFLRRLYVKNSVKGKTLQPHHHIKITEEHRLDLMVWKQFLTTPDVYYRPFMESRSWNAQEIDMYSDASGNFKLGYCGQEWTWGQWDFSFCQEHNPSIEYLELFAMLVGVRNWIRLFRNRRIVLFCDNEAVVHMINKSTSNCKHCMVLIRLLVAECIFQKVRVFAKHVGTKDNGKADALSRLEFNRFRGLGGNHMNTHPTAIPEDLWPMHKIWFHH